MKTKLNINEIVPASDVLLEEMDSMHGGSSHICLKGCVNGERKPDDDDDDEKLGSSK